MTTRAPVASSGGERTAADAGRIPPDGGPPIPPGVGALVISLDFELHWGVRDTRAADGAYRANLLGARRAIPLLLALFDAYGVAATWATVGFLFAATRPELEAYSPRRRPEYRDRRLSPYAEPLGEDEAADPLHYAAGLLRQIRATPRQEIGSHTFSHYFCLEAGADRAAFREDLRSAVAIAAASGVTLRSLVFPRNQHNPSYDDIVRDAGFACFRGNPRGWMYRASDQRGNTLPKRAGRLLDTYAPLAGAHLTRWRDVPRPSGLCDIPASFMLKEAAAGGGAAQRARLGRIRRSLRRAAREGAIVHLWSHPHNFGRHTAAGLDFLRAVLDEYAWCREHHGMLSLGMAEAAALARAEVAHAGP
ncbi:MAG TPA: polysaccharide deacetylase family protein [Longimicrobiales bacterium]|nr:polysaccharide deacetylase family protein [Longimicrobiales bacterium]